jgi:hypothetical protein
MLRILIVHHSPQQKGGKDSVVDIYHKAILSMADEGLLVG